jgi:predicted ribosome quality control (RQC) complex YloA/Tae2 family protein
MNLQEQIRKVLREETKLIKMILRRVPHDDLERKFKESLDATSNNLFNLIINGGGVMPLDRFIDITVSRLIDRIHYELYSTMPLESQWYDEVKDSLKDYYKDRIEVRYTQIMRKL